MPQMINLLTLATFFNIIFLKIKAALTPIVKINANVPQQKPLVTKTHSPLKEKKAYEKIYEYFIENYKTNCVRTFV